MPNCVPNRLTGFQDVGRKKWNKLTVCFTKVKILVLGSKNRRSC